MMARSHLMAGSAIGVAGVSWLYVVQAGAFSGILSDSALDRGGYTAAFSEGFHAAAQYGAIQLWQWVVPSHWSPLWFAGYVMLSVLFFFVGTLAPDMDSKRSMLGRHLHVPGPHRGIIHTDYFWLVVMLLVSIPEPTRAFFWLGLGALIHCELDGLSKAGRVRYYPLTRYKIINQHGERCVVSAGWRTGLYKANAVSEYVVLSVVMVGCVAAAGSAVALTV